jgi:Fibronectin type III domain
MKVPKVPKIKPMLAFEKLPDPELLKYLNTVHDRMIGNPVYPTPTLDLAVFKTAIDTFTVLVTDAADGGKKATSAKNKQRGVVIKMLRQLAHYVEDASDGDLAKFNTSGFVAVPKTRTAPEPLSGAGMDWIDRGPTTGQVVAKVKKLPKAITYYVRYALVGAGGAPGTWTELTLTSPKKTTITNLTPGATYVFQVRALGKLGYTDWSDSMTFICA